MNKIPCQACKGKRKEKGCMTCGGYKVVLEKVECNTCRHPRWVRPGVYTRYEGKQWTSLDGIVVTERGDKPSTCSFCP